jgi:hypothetical protein
MYPPHPYSYRPSVDAPPPTELLTINTPLSTDGTQYGAPPYRSYGAPPPYAPSYGAPAAFPPPYGAPHTYGAHAPFHPPRQP